MLKIVDTRTGDVVELITEPGQYFDFIDDKDEDEWANYELYDEDDNLYEFAMIGEINHG